MNFFKDKALSSRTKLDKFLTKQFTTSQFTYQQIFGMLGPLILDQFFIFFISMLTSSLISSSGEASIAAVALVNPIAMIVMSLFAAVSNGGTVIVAQYKGKGDLHLMKKSAGQVIFTTFLVATVASVLLAVFAGPILKLVYSQTEPEVLRKATNYMVGFCISIPAFSIFNGVFNVLRGVGDTKVCLHLTVIINVIHLIASVLFINVLNLDIMGTAIAFNIARIIGCIMALYIIFSPKGSLTLKLKDIIVFDLPLQKAIILMGIPFAIEQIFMNVGQMINQVYMAPLGQATVAANSISSSISNLFYGAGFGVAVLAITVIGQCIGAGEIDIAKRYAKRMIHLGTIIMTGAVLLIYPLTPLLLKLFRPEVSTIPLIHLALLIGVIPIPFFWSSSYVMPSVLRAAGDANFTSIASLVCMWIFRVVVGYTFAVPLGLGLSGIWISIGLEWACRSVIFRLRFNSGKWLLKKVV